jgi:hypothetical protein
MGRPFPVATAFGGLLLVLLLSSRLLFGRWQHSDDPAAVIPAARLDRDGGHPHEPRSDRRMSGIARAGTCLDTWTGGARTASGGRNARTVRGVLATSGYARQGDSSMVTNYPQQLAATTQSIGTSAARPSLVDRAITRVLQAVCGIRGHESVRHFEGKRVMMRCTACGHDTPGWEITGGGPRRRFERDASRLVLRKSA